MSNFDMFLELDYGNLYSIDLHGKTLQDAKADIIHLLSTIDRSYQGILVIHGYHKGRVLRDYIRGELTHKLIAKKIVLDASRTIILLNF
ncbi:MAG: Smr/MutS family protein [Clostridia bacterium]|nr:Smr/MutS family protein [Clostridia bacterium]